MADFALSNKLVILGRVELGNTPSGTGTVNLSYVDAIYSRNVNDTFDLRILDFGASDELDLFDSNMPVVRLNANIAIPANTLSVTGAVTFSNTLTLNNADGDLIFTEPEQQILFQGCTTYFISNMDSPDEMMFGQGTVSVANTTFAVENGPGFRVRNRMVNEQYMDITARTTTVLTPSGSTATAVSLIPGGAFVVGVTTRVITGITGPTGFDIGDGTDVDRWGNSISGTLNTTSNKVDETAAGHGSFPAGSDIVLTSDGVDFTGGEVRVTVHYMTLQAPAS